MAAASPPSSAAAGQGAQLAHLPHQRRARPPLEEGPRRSYSVVASDDLGARVVRVEDERGQVVWSTTRELTDEEIVTTVLDSARQPRWTIHRPLSGWYLVLRPVGPSPSPRSTSASESSPAASGSFISLKPSPAHGRSYFGFTVRSHLSFPPLELQQDAGTAAGVAGGPPLKSPSFRVDLRRSEPGTDHLADGERTPRASSHENPLDSITPGTSTDSPATASHFLLQPTLPAHTHRASSGAWSLSSWTRAFAGRGRTFSCVWNDEAGAEMLRYEDRPAIWSPTTRGTLFLHESLIDIVGMAPSFWVAVALAYLEYLEDEEAYTAANAD